MTYCRVLHSVWSFSPSVWKWQISGYLCSYRLFETHCHFYSSFSVAPVAITKMLQSEMLDNGGKLIPLWSSVQHVWWHINRKVWFISWAIYKNLKTHSGSEYLHIYINTSLLIKLFQCKCQTSVDSLYAGLCFILNWLSAA